MTEPELVPADARLATAARLLLEQLGLKGELRFTAAPFLGGAYPVGEFAAAAVAAAGLALAELVDDDGPVMVDAALANAWFRAAVRPRAEQPSPWDALTGDYRASDGWIRLHMNAPHHRAAALAVLGLTPADAGAAPPARDAVATAVQPFGCDALETAVVSAGGAAARLRSLAEWAQHPQGVAIAAEPLLDVVETEAARADHPFPAGYPERPLAGVRVLDLTRVLAGPVATRALAMLGADVLRIDPPEWDEPALEPDMTLGKRCARLDAHTVEGRSELLALVAEADVLVHGYRPGALDSIGLDEATLRSVRPGLVEVQLDAWGYSGPWAGRRGFDSLVQLATGIADAATAGSAAPAPSTGEGMPGAADEAPIALPVQALDHATGWIAAAAALRAVAHARRTGLGSRSRVSLARTALELERLRALLGPAEPRPEPPVPSAPLDTPWGTADVLESPVRVGGVRLHTLQPPRPLGSDEPYWFVDDRHDEAEAERQRPSGPRPVVMRPARAVTWALVSAAVVWASQGLLEATGAALLRAPDVGAGWWSNPGWMAGAAAQAVALALGWIGFSRILSVGPALAATVAAGAVAHLIGATLLFAGMVPVSAEQAWNRGTGLALILWTTGAALVQPGVPVLVALARPFLGRAARRRSQCASTAEISVRSPLHSVWNVPSRSTRL